MKQIQEAYIVAATRTPIGVRTKAFSATPVPTTCWPTRCVPRWPRCRGWTRTAIEDVICGCAIPEGAARPERGAHWRRAGRAAQERGRHHRQPFLRVGPVSAVQMAADRIRVGEADVMIAAGTESMSMVPMMGNSPSLSPTIFSNPDDIELRHCLRHGPDGREGRPAVEGQPRSAGRICLPVAHEAPWPP
jgi:acetyl-CoA acyltransferase